MTREESGEGCFTVILENRRSTGNLLRIVSKRVKRDKKLFKRGEIDQSVLYACMEIPLVQLINVNKEACGSRGVEVGPRHNNDWRAWKRASQ